MKIIIIKSIFIFILCTVPKISSMETENAPPPRGPVNPFFPTLKTLCLKLITHDLQKKTEPETKQEIQDYCKKLPENLVSEFVENLESSIERLKCGNILKISPDQNYLLCECRKIKNPYYTYTLYQNNKAGLSKIHSRNQHVISSLLSDEIAFTHDKIALINQTKISIDIFQLPEFKLLSSIDREEFGRSTVIDFANNNTLIGYQKIFGQKIHVFDLTNQKLKSINFPDSITHCATTDQNTLWVVNNIGDQRAAVTYIKLHESRDNKIEVIKILNGLSFINDITHNKDLVAFASNKNIYLCDINQNQQPTIHSVSSIPKPTFQLTLPIQCIRFSPDNTHLAVAHSLTLEKKPCVSIVNLLGERLLEIDLTISNLSWNKELIMQPINPHEHTPVIRQLPGWALDAKKKINYKRTLARFAQKLIEEQKRNEILSNNNNV